MNLHFPTRLCIIKPQKTKGKNGESMAQYPYLDMFCRDDSGVSVEHWNDSWSVDMHAHDYCELMLVNRGSCRHAFHGIETLLIPGDAVLIPPHEAHGYALSGEISLYNCQFVPDRLDPGVTALLHTHGLLHEQKQTAEHAFWEHQIADRQAMHAKSLPTYEFNSSKQGVIHLSPAELTFIVSLLEHTLSEQEEQGEDSVLLRRKYIDVILGEVQKTQNHQNCKYADCSEEQPLRAVRHCGGRQTVRIQSELPAQAVQRLYRCVAYPVHQPSAYDPRLRGPGKPPHEHQGSRRVCRNLRSELFLAAVQEDHRLFAE